MALSDEIKVDDASDVATICGIRYSGELFRGFGFDLKPGRSFRILQREDGVVTIHVMQDDQPPNAVLAERERWRDAYDLLVALDASAVSLNNARELAAEALEEIRKGETA
jgi:hypothetical protein